MTAAERDKYGEYGGTPGTIHTAEEGHVTLEPAEGARILRTYGIRNPDTPAGGQVTVNQGIDPATGEKWTDEPQVVRQKRYQDTQRLLNGYTPEDVQ